MIESGLELTSMADQTSMNMLSLDSDSADFVHFFPIRCSLTVFA